ncbi:hypothetical protein EVAR_17935_1 [Eumeta japonica]|uniref:FLYWCH-type domain-containing protein n=1 Tax=Eumeta variegata TaxID=151549 RepID=A0A4C1UZJ8_EUMVA|nr:hypothetical protein EVAR_17935_1 [Eumeta japonica]
MSLAQFESGATAEMRAPDQSCRSPQCYVFSRSSEKPYFQRSRFGNPLILMGSYRFYRSGKTKHHIRWICSNRSCKAIVFTAEDVIIYRTEILLQQTNIEHIVALTFVEIGTICLLSWSAEQNAIIGKSSKLIKTADRFALISVTYQVKNFIEKEGLRPIFSTTRCGGIAIQVGSYRYTTKSKRGKGPRTRWSCSSRKSKKCNAYLITMDDVIVEQMPHINH